MDGSRLASTLFSLFLFTLIPRSTPSVGSAAMDVHADLDEWEILLSPDGARDYSMPFEAPGYRLHGGAIKSDYFAIYSDNPYERGADRDVQGGEVNHADSVRLTSVDSESESQFRHQPKVETGASGIEFFSEDLSWHSSDDECSDAQKPHISCEKGEFGGPGALELGVDAMEDEESDTEVSVEGTADMEGSKAGFDRLHEDDSALQVKQEDKNCISSVEMGDATHFRSNSVSPSGGEKRGVVWWKFPYVLLKLCAFKAKPVWSISIAAAILGVWLIWKRLYRMKQKTYSIPLKISLDEQKASQLKMQAIRLNEVFDIARRVSNTRALPSAGRLIQRTSVGLQ